MLTTDHSPGPTEINSIALMSTTKSTTLTPKESAPLPEECSSSSLDTVLVVHLSLSSVESVEVFTPKLLMSVLILSERTLRILKKMILTTQVPLPITSVTMLVILLVWDLIFSDLLLSHPALPSSLVLPPTNLFKPKMLSSSQFALLPLVLLPHGLPFS